MASGRHHTDPAKIAQVARWRGANAERVREMHRLKRIAYKGRRNEMRRRRWREDAQFRLGEVLRGRLWKALKGRARRGSAVGLLGCTLEELKAHLERQFLRGMSWGNHGSAWEIDHIRPLAGFDLTDPAQLADASHFTNLRPLWAEQNARKRAEKECLL